MTVTSGDLGPPRWAWISLVGLVAVGVVAMVACMLAFGFSLLNRSDESAESAEAARVAAEATRLSSHRADCRSEYNAILSDEVRTRDNLDASADAQFGAVIIQRQVEGTLPSQEEIDRYVETQRLLAEQITLTDSLPRLDEAVDKGFALEGMEYLPCPKVE